MFDAVAALDQVIENLDRDAREPTQLRALLVPELRRVIALGHAPIPRSPQRRVGSSDLGNISDIVPAIHPMIAISDGDPVPHTAAFAAALTARSSHSAAQSGGAASSSSNCHRRLSQR